MRALILCGAGLIAVAGVAWRSGALERLTGDASRGAVTACEKAVVDGLQTPASYQRIWADYTPRSPLSNAERREWGEAARRSNCYPYCDSPAQRFSDSLTDNIDNEIERKQRLHLPLTGLEQAVVDTRRMDAESVARNAPEDQTAFVTLEFDAQNGYGASLRAFSVCRFGPIGADGKFDKRDIIQSGPIDPAEGRAAKELAARLSRYQ